MNPTWMMRVLVAEGEASALATSFSEFRWTKKTRLPSGSRTPNWPFLRGTSVLTLWASRYCPSWTTLSVVNATAARRTLGWGGGGVGGISIRVEWLRGESHMLWSSL